MSVLQQANKIFDMCGMNTVASTKPHINPVLGFNDNELNESHYVDDAMNNMEALDALRDSEIH